MRILETKTPNDATIRVLVSVFVLSLAWSIWATTRGWDYSLLDGHGFRQTQTALTSYYMIHGRSSFLAYETPVLGAPWSIPFEFPLYQWLAAKATLLFGIPLHQAGRLVSVIFFALCLVVLWGILSELKVERRYRLVFIALTLVCPLYAFWSRTFMIESTALFFCMAYLFFALRYLRAKAVLDVGTAALCGALGGLVKTTTLPVFMLTAGILYVVQERDNLWPLARAVRFRVLSRHLLVGIALVAIPLVAIAAWTHHADRLKELNILGKDFTSVHEKAWLFGTVSQKLSPSTWNAWLRRTAKDVMGYLTVFAFLLGSFFFMRKFRWHVIVCLLLFLFPPLVFTNLYSIHEYYAYANALFLIGAFGWAIIALLQEGGGRAFVGMGLLVLCLSASILRYHRSFYWLVRDNQHDSFVTPELVPAIRSLTKPEEVIIVFGLSWTSEVAYYSERRALMWPRETFDSHSQVLQGALAGLEGYRTGALVFGNEARNQPAQIECLVRQFGLAPVPAYQDKICSVYARTP
jgi:hypothetical protein